MKQKAFLNESLAWMLVLGLGLTAISCTGDDLTEEEQEEQEIMDASSKFWSVAGQLVSMDECTDDYKDKTFEPTIGTPMAEDELTRVVGTNSMSVAAQRFSALVGVDIDPNTTTEYTYSDPDVGTLSYHKSTDGRSWATVDVDIKQIPHLQTIVYQSNEQGNTNASFDGKAYYRFGDVVSREYGNQTEYWVCVRPAFGRESKSESYWVCLNTLPHTRTSIIVTNGHQYYFPRLLGQNFEQQQNLAEMLYAICNPVEWEKNVSSYSIDSAFGPAGLPFFTDFHRANLQYHNHLFWENVQKGWEANDILSKAFNIDDLETLKNSIDRDGLNFIYDGKPFSSSAYIFNTASYTNGKKTTTLNLHNCKAITGWKEKIGRQQKLDFRVMGGALENYSEFFGDKVYRWTIIHASGSELSSAAKNSITGQLAGCTDVYRYYDQYPEAWDEDGQNPEITK